MATRRGASNGNSAGSAEDRRRRKVWLVETYRANMDLIRTRDGIYRTMIPGLIDPYAADGDTVLPACRCYRCGKLLTVETVTADRIRPGCEGGTYRRENIRPSCIDCASHTGGKIGAARREANKR